jgi:hypothetical protein
MWCCCGEWGGWFDFELRLNLDPPPVLLSQLNVLVSV